MKYFSDVTNKVYDTEEELVKAEEKHNAMVLERENAEKAKKEAREAAAKEVQDAMNKANAARNAWVEAHNEATKKLRDFCKTYGGYHMTINGQQIQPVCMQTPGRTNRDPQKINISELPYPLGMLLDMGMNMLFN